MTWMIRKIFWSEEELNMVDLPFFNLISCKFKRTLANS